MLYDYLNDFAKKTCSCGKNHNIFIPQIFSGAGATNNLSKILSDFGAKKIFLISDVNAFEVHGEKILDVLSRSNVAVVKCIFQNRDLKPNDTAVGNAILHFQKDCDVIISVGSGVLNDIGKIVSAVSGKKYVIVGTAPSMDGYASSTSSVDVDGLKVSLPSKCADAIIGDVDILKTAPLPMLQAGLGDMLAKYISIAEWRIAHELVGEYYCEEIANMVRMSLKKCVENADGLLKRDERAVEAVFEGLVLCGIAMSFAGLSRPASGVEHYFSHVWDMRTLQFGVPGNFHGLQCAVGTKIAAGLYEKVLLLKPDKEKALNYAKAFDYQKWCETLNDLLGESATPMIENEKKEQKYNLEKHEKRLEMIISKWDAICNIIREEIPSENEIDQILDSIGAPKTPDGIGISCDLFTVFKATKDIRDKYVLSRLLWDLGEIDNFVKYF